uniref:Uncharacterized protein n=1 Tax=Corethron hystrix TaxID=216773 RepID=A0A7S1BWC7_9STRA
MNIDSFVAHSVSSAPASRDDRHDHVEQAALGGSADAAVFAVIRALTGDRLDTSLQVPEYTYETWHLAAAAVLGGLSGLLGLFFILLLAIFEQLRKRLSDRFFKKGALRWVGAVLFPVLALSACGYVEKQHPYGVGSDISRLYQLVEYAASLDAANDISDDCAPLIKDPTTMLHAALLKVTLTALSLGFGLVGGIVLPLLFAGLCLAVAVLLAVPSLPVLVVLPCVTVSVCGSFVPLPFFFSFLMVSVLPVDGSVGAPIFVSVLAAYTLNIGLGFIPFALTRKTRKLQEEITMRRNQEYQHDFEDSLPRMS